MKIIRTPAQMQKWSEAQKRRGLSVGFVPTMGALHAGHLDLVARARRQNKRVVVSIFVNPSQFGPQEDFKKYPRPVARDKKLLTEAGVDALFMPPAAAMYPAGSDTWVTVDKMSAPLCGLFRPGHFRGVATVVAKLLNATAPTRAYFGMKDFQQLQIIRRLARDLFMPVQIVACPTVREKDGLAMSSRNAYLSPADRERAARIYRALRHARELVKSRRSAPWPLVRARVLKELKSIPGARPQYVALADPETLGPPRRGRKTLLAVAVYLGPTRLIDNILL
jgi:pantoate--beta-alanine ligase